MKFEVLTVADCDLPAGIHRVIVEREDGPPLLIINGEALRTWRLLRAWEEGLEPSVCVPVPSLLLDAG